MESNVGYCGIEKHKRRKPFESGEKCIVLNIFSKFMEKNPILSVSTEFIGLSVSTMLIIEIKAVC